MTRLLERNVMGGDVLITACIWIAMMMPLEGCRHSHKGDRGYSAYLHYATDAKIVLKVVDEHSMPIKGALIHCHVTVPDWPSKNPDPGQSYRSYKTILTTNEDGMAVFAKDKIVSFIVKDVVKPSYAFVYEKSHSGLPMAIYFGYSTQAIATGDYIETSPTNPYILRMKPAEKEEESTTATPVEWPS